MQIIMVINPTRIVSISHHHIGDHTHFKGHTNYEYKH